MKRKEYFFLLSASHKSTLKKHFHNKNARRTDALTSARRWPQQINEVSIMVKSNLIQLERSAQHLTHRFKRLEDLMDEAWLEHELIRENLRDLFTIYYRWLGEEGIEHKRH